MTFPGMGLSATLPKKRLSRLTKLLSPAKSRLYARPHRNAGIRQKGSTVLGSPFLFKL